MLWARRNHGFWLALALLALAPRGARAGQPQLDAVANERGIAAGELAIASQVETPAGGEAVALRRALSLHGLPLRGAFETRWRSPGGDERTVASRYPAGPPRLRPSEARVGVGEARKLVTELLAERQGRAAEPLVQPADLDGELVYLLLLDQPVLAWELTAPLTTRGGTPSRLRVWVSAGSGGILDAEEQIDLENDAEVYGINPVQTPMPSLVGLTNITAEQPPWLEEQVFDQQYLTGTRVRVFNCVDEDDGAPLGPWHDEGECYPSQRVVADLEGDFFVPVPDVTLAADNLDPTDLYAELSMYFHAERFFSVMADKGVESFPCELSNMVANFHYLEPAPRYPELDFGPYNNAYYTGVCDVESGPTMVFGQGSAVDFAFDGDVVYHELGHGIVELLTPEGLRGYHLRDDGVLRDARALNEAIADYHTLMLTDRPELGDYVGFYWADYGQAWIRNGENEQVCPRDMAGQEHNDSEPVSAALWAARRRIGGDKLDPVVLAMLPMLARDTSIEEAMAALLQVAAVQREAGIWTEAEYEELERTLAARNLLDCERVIDDPASHDDPFFAYLRGNTRWVAPFYPGPVQYRHVVPAGSDNVLISFEVAEKGNSAGQPVDHDLETRVLVKRSGVSEDASMVFDYELTGLGHADEDGEGAHESWLVSGDWDELYVPTTLTEERRQVLIRGLDEGEAIHVTFANLDPRIAVISELRFASVPSEELDEGSPGEGRPEDAPIDEGGSSCACTGAPSGGSGGGLAVGLLVLLAVRRRSRQR